MIPFTTDQSEWTWWSRLHREFTKKKRVKIWYYRTGLTTCCHLSTVKPLVLFVSACSRLWFNYLIVYSGVKWHDLARPSIRLPINIWFLLLLSETFTPSRKIQLSSFTGGDISKEKVLGLNLWWILFSDYFFNRGIVVVIYSGWQYLSLAFRTI